MEEKTNPPLIYYKIYTIFIIKPIILNLIQNLLMFISQRSDLILIINIMHKINGSLVLSRLFNFPYFSFFRLGVGVNIIQIYATLKTV